MNFGRWINEPPREVNQITKRIMIMKKLIIEQLKEGFIFTDENDEKYAVSSGSMSRKVHAYFGMTRPDSRKIKHIAPPAKASDPKETRTQGNMTPDSHSGGAASQSSTRPEWIKERDLIKKCDLTFEEV